MTSPSTFNLSALYRAMGIRDPRAVPGMVAGEILPVVVVGQMQTFSPEVIEARGVWGSEVSVPASGLASWAAKRIQARSEGGMVVEHADFGNVQGFGEASLTVNIAPNEPWVENPGTESILNCGGQPLRAHVNSASGAFGAPFGNAFGGTFTPCTIRRDQGVTIEAFRSIWIPAGWYFWILGQIQGGRLAFNIKFRELPEMQGPA